jgi:hypothetical protein
MTVNRKEETGKLLRLLSGFRPRIWPSKLKVTGKKIIKFIKLQFF